jgi:tetratricopeptide (TPR) repeat protein
MDRRLPLFRQMVWCSVALTLLSGCALAARRHNVAGKQLFESGQTSQAINEFQTALTRDNRNPDAWYNLGATYYALGKQANHRPWIDQAETLFRQAISINDRHQSAHRALAALLVETGRERFAFDLLQTWRNRHPELSDPLVELARLHQEFGDVTRAGDYLADAIRIEPNNPRVLKAMGHVRERQGQWAMALDNYGRSYQLDNRQLDVASRINEIQARLAGNLQNPLPGTMPLIPGGAIR